MSNEMEDSKGILCVLLLMLFGAAHCAPVDVDHTCHKRINLTRSESYAQYGTRVIRAIECDDEQLARIGSDFKSLRHRGYPKSWLMKELDKTLFCAEAVYSGMKPYGRWFKRKSSRKVLNQQDKKDGAIRTGIKIVQGLKMDKSTKAKMKKRCRLMVREVTNNRI